MAFHNFTKRLDNPFELHCNGMGRWRTSTTTITTITTTTTSSSSSLSHPAAA
jgi:hypothetical protein